MRRQLGRPLCHPPITVPRPFFGGRPRCMSLSSGRTALCRVLVACAALRRRWCPRYSRRLRARACQVLPEICVHIGERALHRINHLRRSLAVIPACSPLCASRSSFGSCAEQDRRNDCGHHDARLFGGPRRGQATPLRSVPCGLAGLTEPAVRRTIRQLRDGRRWRPPICSAERRHRFRARSCGVMIRSRRKRNRRQARQRAPQSIALSAATTGSAFSFASSLARPRVIGSSVKSRRIETHHPR